MGNYVKNHHQQLKKAYLQRKGSKSANCLAWIAISSIDADFIYNASRVILNSGLMGLTKQEN